MNRHFILTMVALAMVSGCGIAPSAPKALNEQLAGPLTSSRFVVDKVTITFRSVKIAPVEGVRCMCYTLTASVDMKHGKDVVGKKLPLIIKFDGSQHGVSIRRIESEGEAVMEKYHRPIADGLAAYAKKLKGPDAELAQALAKAIK